MEVRFRTLAYLLFGAFLLGAGAVLFIGRGKLSEARRDISTAQNRAQRLAAELRGTAADHRALEEELGDATEDNRALREQVEVLRSHTAEYDRLLKELGNQSAAGSERIRRIGELIEEGKVLIEKELFRSKP